MDVLLVLVGCLMLGLGCPVAFLAELLTHRDRCWLHTCCVCVLHLVATIVAWWWLLAAPNTSTL